MKAADDYAAINRRMAEIKGESVHAPPHLPWCPDCANTGWERRVTQSSGWVRVVCERCGNPHDLP